MSEPSALKEKALKQLLEIRETLLSLNCQELIEQLPQERQREICQIISQAQISYLKLQKVCIEELTNEMRLVETALLESMKAMQESMDSLSKLESFMNEATLFIKTVQNIVKIVSPSI